MSFYCGLVVGMGGSGVVEFGQLPGHLPSHALYQSHISRTIADRGKQRAV